MPVEQLRNVLLIGLIAVSFLLWTAWQQDYGPRPPSAPAPASSEQVPGGENAAGAPAAPVATEVVGDVPTVPSGNSAGPSSTDPSPIGQAGVAAAGSGGGTVTVRTDSILAEIDLLGGSLRRLDLLAYPVSVDEPEQPFTLLGQHQGNTFFAQSGIASENGGPTHHSAFIAERTSYELEDGQESLDVRLRWTGEDGLEVVKTYTFRRDSYLVDVAFDVYNGGSGVWSGGTYGQLHRNQVAATGGLFRTYTYTGGVVSRPDKPYEKITFDDMRETRLDQDVVGGWVAMIEHYFAVAWIPGKDSTNHFYTNALDNGRFVLGTVSPASTIRPGETGRLSMQIYAGPKVQSRMAPVAPHLERTVDYGWLWLIAEPLFWLLQKIHSIIGNWGWSIILLTLLIKLAFFHLSATSYRSMANMRRLQPRLTTLRERYGSDRQRLNQAMMELYKEEKINPLGGCLPILVQIPVFIALYWVLLESVELRQASFIFWLNDLSIHDPYFVLPVMMGITMLIQQRLNPAPPDPMQAKVMMALPFVFTFLFLFFPSGLVLYWFVNNCLSILQQWVITRKIVGTATT